MSIGEVTLIAIDALDSLSRLRALTDVESFNLQRLIVRQESSVSGRARLDAWMDLGLIQAMHIPEYAFNEDSTALIAPRCSRQRKAA